MLRELLEPLLVEAAPPPTADDDDDEAALEELDVGVSKLMRAPRLYCGVALSKSLSM